MGHGWKDTSCVFSGPVNVGQRFSPGMRTVDSFLRQTGEVAGHLEPRSLGQGPMTDSTPSRHTESGHHISKRREFHTDRTAP